MEETNACARPAITRKIQFAWSIERFDPDTYGANGTTYIQCNSLPFNVFNIQAVLYPIGNTQFCRNYLSLYIDCSKNILIEAESICITFAICKDGQRTFERSSTEPIDTSVRFGFDKFYETMGRATPSYCCADGTLKINFEIEVKYCRQRYTSEASTLPSPCNTLSIRCRTVPAETSGQLCLSWLISKFACNNTDGSGGDRRSPMLITQLGQQQIVWQLQLLQSNQRNRLVFKLSIVNHDESALLVVASYRLAIIKRNTLLGTGPNDYWYSGCATEPYVVNGPETLFDDGVDCVNVLCYIDPLHSSHVDSCGSFEWPVSQRILNSFHVPMQLLRKPYNLVFVFKDDDESAVCAHKSILSAKSRIFRSMFENNTVSPTTTYVKVDEYSSVTMRLMVNFLYTGNVPNAFAFHAFELLMVADRYEIMALKSLCENELSGNIRMVNAIGMLIFADNYDAVLLKCNSVNFIVDNYHVMMDEGYLQDIELLEQGNLFYELMTAIFQKFNQNLSTLAIN